jgi:hypothetical protein
VGTPFSITRARCSDLQHPNERASISFVRAGLTLRREEARPGIEAPVFSFERPFPVQPRMRSRAPRLGGTQDLWVCLVLFVRRYLPLSCLIIGMAGTASSNTRPRCVDLEYPNERMPISFVRDKQTLCREGTTQGPEAPMFRRLTPAASLPVQRQWIRSAPYVNLIMGDWNSGSRLRGMCNPEVSLSRFVHLC